MVERLGSIIEEVREGPEYCVQGALTLVLYLF